MASTTAPIATQADPLAGMLLRTSLGLVVVLVLIFALAWMMRRWGSAWRPSGQVPLQVVGSLSLGPRERVLVIAVEDTWLVVGVSSAGMRTLHTLPAGELPQPAARFPVAPASGLAGSFTQRLQQALRRREG